jgi:low temperature requirement protein LtrA
VATRLICRAKLWPAQEHYVRRPDWTELFFDLVFAAAISQLSGPLEHDFTVYGVAKYAFLLTLVFLAWFGYTAFSTQYAIDDVLQRGLIIAQVFLVAVMAANATDGLHTRDAAGFGAAYGGVRAILALQYTRVLRLPDCRSLARRRIVGLLVAAFVWAGSALCPAPQRYALWALALLIDIGNSWPSVRATTASPPGATHFPERFGLLTIILLGEFVASVMRGIQSQMGWSFLPASAAVLSLALGFAIWSCYSDGANGWKTRQIRSNKDVRRLHIWIALHLLLFLGIGILGVTARQAIALPPDGRFPEMDQTILCATAAGTMLVIIGIGATSRGHFKVKRLTIVALQAGIALVVLIIAGVASFIVATAVLLLLFVCFLAQTALLLATRDEVAA